MFSSRDRPRPAPHALQPSVHTGDQGGHHEPVLTNVRLRDRNDQFQAFCYFSDDDGRTWQSSTEQMDLPGRGAEEPSVVELKDGSLQIQFPSNNRH
jgi:hypothetical protein